MRDIGRRIQRYRLSRYAAPQNPVRRRIGWVWIGLIAWFLWAGLLSDHSFYQLWRVDREKQGAEVELAKTRAEIAELEAAMDDPKARAEQSERALRERGMAKPGEIVYRIRGGEADSDSAGAARDLIR